MHPFEQHLTQPRGRGPVPDGAFVGSAGGAACGDVVRMALCIEDGRLTQVTFDAEGCGATIAAGSACAVLTRGQSVFEAAALP
ncbi:MAG TPA: iron-sulfur cluster assembly scaffold protein, partial [Solirubrobacterales bacterium]|nr:iron-sulfur cluster assembly scaffold protein [Solirubrobacterales bacterium]